MAYLGCKGGDGNRKEESELISRDKVGPRDLVSSLQKTFFPCGRARLRQRANHLSLRRVEKRPLPREKKMSVKNGETTSERSPKESTPDHLSVQGRFVVCARERLELTSSHFHPPSQSFLVNTSNKPSLANSSCPPFNCLRVLSPGEREKDHHLTSRLHRSFLFPSLSPLGAGGVFC